MRTLAELTFEYLWLLMFAGEDTIDLDYSVKCQESLPEYFAAFTAEEKAALAAVAANVQSRLLAEPDQHGYTPRKIVTDEEKQFLSALASGELFEQWA
jgi:hypothetical protein